MNESETNLLKAFSEFVWPEPEAIFYRLYYDELGNPLFYTMENLPGNYIDITQEQFAQGLSNVKVKDGQLLVIDPATSASKLVPGGSGTPCHPDNVSIVVDDAYPNVKWSFK
jgi:hypothetical protein